MIVAWVALLSWPLVALTAFRVATPPVALAVTMIGGYLLLPMQVGYDLPLLPRFDKSSIPVLSAVLGLLMLGRRQDILPGWLPRHWLLLTCLALLVGGSFGTALTNLSPTFSGLTRPGLQVYDGFSLTLNALIMILPFLLARKVLATTDAQRTFLLCFLIAACGYALLALYEVRMSPQLHNTVYGFFQDSWLQHMRDGGFRPIVFLRHALWVGVLLAMAVIIGLGFCRLQDWRFLGAAFFCFVTLFFAKTLGAFLVTFVLGSIVLFTPLRVWRLAAMACAAMLLLFPALRSANLVPLGPVVTLAESINPARAESFKVRLQNEDVLLARAAEKPVFGWGTFGRERVYDEFTGRGGISDGFWIINLGQGGWVRYLGLVGLMTIPIILLGLSRDPPEIATLMAIALAVNLIDLIPNAAETPLTWMLAGALAGMLERRRTQGTEEDQIAAGPTPVRGAPVLRRDFSVEAEPQGRGEERAEPAPTYSRTHKPADPSPGRIARTSRFSE